MTYRALYHPTSYNGKQAKLAAQGYSNAGLDISRKLRPLTNRYPSH